LTFIIYFLNIDVEIYINGSYGGFNLLGYKTRNNLLRLMKRESNFFLKERIDWFEKML
jgi:hypothetical protein